MVFQTLMRNPRRAFAAAETSYPRAGRILLVSMLLVAGVGAAVAPFLADLVTAGAGVMIIYLAVAAWTIIRQGTGLTRATKFLEAV